MEDFMLPRTKLIEMVLRSYIDEYAGYCIHCEHTKDSRLRQKSGHARNCPMRELLPTHARRVPTYKSPLAIPARALLAKIKG